MYKARRHKHTGPPSGSHHLSESGQLQAGILGERLSGGTGGEPASHSISGAIVPCVLENKSAFLDRKQFTNESLTALITDLHACLKNVPNYKDDKEWKSMPSLSELADHLVGQVRKYVPSGHHWLANNNEDGPQIQYYKFIKGLEDYNAMPLEWLPALQAQNEDLHNLVMGTIYYVAKLCDLELIITRYDDYYIDDCGMRETEDGELQMIIESDVAKYKKGGIANQYLKDMRSFYGIYSKENVIDMILNFRPKGPLQKEIKAWLNIGISVILAPVDLDSYILPDPDFNRDDGEPVTIKDAIKFTWSFYDNVFRNSEEWINDTYSNIGAMDSGVMGAFTNHKHIHPQPIDKIKALLMFMQKGRGIYFTHYDKNIKQFYDKRGNGDSL